MFAEGDGGGTHSPKFLKFSKDRERENSTWILGLYYGKTGKQTKRTGEDHVKAFTEGRLGSHVLIAACSLQTGRARNPQKGVETLTFKSQKRKTERERDNEE